MLTLYITGYAYGTTESELAELFSEIGAVVSDIAPMLPRTLIRHRLNRANGSTSGMPCPR